MATHHAKLKVLLFDADGTLWDFERAMRHGLARTLAEIEHRLPACRGLLSVEDMIATRDRAARELMADRWTHEAIRLESFRRTLSAIGHPDEAMARELTAFYLRHRFEGTLLYPDVLPALDRLRQRYRLGLLTNGNTYPERCGLGGYFEFTVFGQDCGLQKPDSRLFVLAIAKAGCRRDEIAHIGDSLTNDVAGAKNAGMVAVWLNRRREPGQVGIEPDLEVASLEGLFDVL